MRSPLTVLLMCSSMGNARLEYFNGFWLFQSKLRWYLVGFAVGWKSLLEVLETTWFVAMERSAAAWFRWTFLLVGLTSFGVDRIVDAGAIRGQMSHCGRCFDRGLDPIECSLLAGFNVLGGVEPFLLSLLVDTKPSS